MSTFKKSGDIILPPKIQLGQLILQYTVRFSPLNITLSVIETELLICPGRCIAINGFFRTLNVETCSSILENEKLKKHFQQVDQL